MTRWASSRRGGALITALGAILALAGPVSAATVSGTYAISSYEYYATSTQGRFAGTATGSTGDRATWNAVVNHPPLTTTAEITGGRARLFTSRLVSLSGTFTGGAVTLTYEADGCGIQRYAVEGSLGSVTRSDRSTVGTGTFTATLTHYRARILGSCVVYAARVAGAIGLSF